MALIPLRGYYFNNVYYLRVSMENVKDPTITTDVLDFDEACFSGVNNEKVMFPIKKSKSETLWGKVLGLEHAVALLIRDLDDDIYLNMPQVCKDIYYKYESTNSLVRSNYFDVQDEEPTFYLKGNIPNIVITDFSNNPIDSKQLGQGKYQFVIRANLLYFGQHTDETSMVNLQLRISHIKFSPLSSMLEDNSTNFDNPDGNSTQGTQFSTPVCNRVKRVAPGAPKKLIKRRKALLETPQ